jgi:elongation factor P--(R)-beta-lysine ligase
MQMWGALTWIAMVLHPSTTDAGASIAALEQRAALLRRLREFFYERGFIEVETPLIAGEIIPELHIEPMQLADGSFLQASPELHMKRLMAAGAKAIFQITRSFRSGERGRLHNPEFTIVEWYKVGQDMQAGADLLDELIRTMLGTTPAARSTYANAFRRTINLCPHTATLDELISAAKTAHLDVPEGLHRTDRDEWLNLLLSACVEPQLGRDRPEIIYNYPATQASLAQITSTQLGYNVAERFELYYRGIELANGFHELTDSTEQRRRFEAINAARESDGRRTLPLPESLLAAMDHGLPDCTGVALGFDRLVMLALDATCVGEVLSFPQTPA